MNSLKHHGFYYGALLYAFTVPFPQKIINIVLIIWVLLSLVGSSWRTVVKNNFLWVLPAFYSTYFIGVFTSETSSFKFMEYKLSLLIFPLLFFLHAYDEKQRNEILKVFVLGLAASVAFCFITALYRSITIENGELFFQPNVLAGKGFMESILYGGNYFFGRFLSIFHQTVYYAMYLCAGIAVLLFRPKLFSEKLRANLLGVFIIFIFLVSNKASFLVLTLILGIKMYTWQVGRNKKLMGFSLFVLLITALTIFNPRMRESALNALDGQLVIDKEARFGFSTRLLSWDAAISLIKERPIFGYGHADTQHVLNERYQAKGYVHPLKESHNAHNLWLQSWLENGISAILILIGIFWMLSRTVFQKGRFRPLLFCFVWLLLVNSMFEGLFNRFSGISFFSFLFCFMVSKSKGGQTVQ